MGRPFQREMVIHNLGRQQQQLTWTSEKLDEVRKEYAKAIRATGVCSRAQERVRACTPVWAHSWWSHPTLPSLWLSAWREEHVGLLAEGGQKEQAQEQGAPSLGLSCGSPLPPTSISTSISSRMGTHSCL